MKPVQNKDGTWLFRLEPPEFIYAATIAVQRDACKGSMREHKYSSKTSGFGVHLCGVIGELCLVKVCGGKMNTDILPSGDGHKADVKLKDGRNVEVKTSTFSGKNVELKLNPEEIEGLEWVCLVQLFLPDMAKVFPVWSFEKLRHKLTQADYGKGPRLIYSPYKQGIFVE